MDAEAAEAVCYVCLHSGQGLTRWCKCPSLLVHPLCAARWQLHRAGTEEERECRFCRSSLPDWKNVLTPQLLRAAGAGPSAAAPCSGSEGTATANSSCSTPPDAYMRISYNGVSHKIKVRPGAEGRQQFVDDCRALLAIPHTVDFEVIFHCREPVSGGSLSFKSLQCYDAAVACASLSSLAVSRPCCEDDEEEQPSEAAPLPQPLDGPAGLASAQGGLVSEARRRETLPLQSQMSYGDLSLGSADGQQRQVGAGLLPSMISEVARRIRSLYS